MMFLSAARFISFPGHDKRWLDASLAPRNVWRCFTSLLFLSSKVGPDGSTNRPTDCRAPFRAWIVMAWFVWLVESVCCKARESDKQGFRLVRSKQLNAGGLQGSPFATSTRACKAPGPGLFIYFLHPRRKARLHLINDPKKKWPANQSRHRFTVHRCKSCIPRSHHTDAQWAIYASSDLRRGVSKAEEGGGSSHI